MITDRKKIGQLFVEAGIIDDTKLAEALLYKKQHNVYLGTALKSLKMATENDIIKMVSHQLRIPWVDPLTFKIKKKALFN